MNHIGYHHIIGLMKFFSCREYAEDLLKGTFYCHESGWFRKLEDSYRGDMNDGKRPFDITGLEIQIGKIKGIGSGVMRKGFDGDNKLPIYSLTTINRHILEKTNNEYTFKSDFLQKMSQFGEYVVLLTNRDKVMSDVYAHAKANSLVLTECHVSYVDIFEEYDIHEKASRSLKAFFYKDKKYEYQNEFRIMWQHMNGLPLIDKSNDFVKIELGHPLDGVLLHISQLLKVCLVSNKLGQWRLKEIR